MPSPAKVTEVEALRAFRAILIVYLSKARPTLEEVNADVMRTRLWLQTSQRHFWETEVRKRTRRLESAQQALFGARLSTLSQGSTLEQAAMRKAKAALEEAEGKLRLAKQWDREFDNKVEPLARQLEKLQTFLTNDMVKAIAYLEQAAKTLD